MTELRILMVNFEFPPLGGGGGYAHRSLLHRFARRDSLVVDVLTSGINRGLAKEQIADNVTIYRVGIHKKNLHRWRKIEVLEWLFKGERHYRRLIKEQQYDLVHAFFGFPSGWFCYRRADFEPYIISLRGSDVPGRNIRFRWDYRILAPLFQAIWHRASAVVALSEGLRTLGKKFTPDLPIEVIPNGVDHSTFRPRATLLRHNSGPMRLLTVGRLSETKRVELLVEAMEVLSQSDFPARLTIVGEGHLFNKIARDVQERSLTAVIHMTGRIENARMPQIYREHELFVSATYQEGMSNAMLEAMASGLPIVTTRWRGGEALIRDNGLLVEPASPSTMAEAIRSILTDTAAYERMSAAARETAKLYTWDNVAEEYIRLYETIVVEKRKNE
ncbi:glycosyltransferase [candidate division CSSED10-310 bacterium]|uniref:Glycosyltransferase n=1 Tax=candidate division CSSED10-310 bacterium TaxID=2855610 RepID=A0ABV6YYK2_UNCC1